MQVSFYAIFFKATSQMCPCFPMEPRKKTNPTVLNLSFPQNLSTQIILAWESKLPVEGEMLLSVGCLLNFACMCMLIYYISRCNQVFYRVFIIFIDNKLYAKFTNSLHISEKPPKYLTAHTKSILGHHTVRLTRDAFQPSTDT